MILYCIFPAAQDARLVRRGGRSNGDKNESGTKTRAETRQRKESAPTQRQEKTVACRHGSFRHAPVGAPGLSSAALASNSLRAVFRGMRGIRYHTGSVRIVDDALGQSRYRSKLIGPRTRNRPHQCRRCPQSPRATRAPRAPPQPGRRTHGACAIDPRRRATDAKDVLADATRTEASARAAPLAGAQCAHHNPDPPHQRQQSSWPDDLSAQLRSNDRRRVSLDRPTAHSGSECVGLSVGLGRAKGVEGHASLQDRSQGAVAVERTIEALSIEYLRHETNVGHRDGIAIAEATGETRASHVSIQTSQSLSDPMAIPRLVSCIVGTELRLDVLEHTYIIKRVNITADDLRHRSH